MDEKLIDKWLSEFIEKNRHLLLEDEMGDEEEAEFYFFNEKDKSNLMIAVTTKKGKVVILHRTKIQD